MSSDEPRLSDRMSRSVLRGFAPAEFRRARERAGMSRSDLARLSGIKTAETIRRWELGLASPQVDILAGAIRALAIPADEVIITQPDTRSLADWRHLRLLTQPQLASAANMSTSLVQQLESGLGTLTTERAERLAVALELEVGEVQRAHERARRRPPGAPA